MKAGERGFTLLEVVVAMGILALSLGVLLQAQVSSLAAAGRTRGLTIATLLARAKMVDVEQRLFDEGFTLGDQEEEGDFADEGQRDFKWTYKVTEVKLDLALLDGLAGGGEDEDEDEDEGFGGVLAGVSGPMEILMKQMGESIRVVDLTVSWPEGKYTESLRVRSVVTRDDLDTLGRRPAAGGQPLPGAPTPGGSLER